MPVIIIGSHLGFANYEFPLLPALDADDGGSGTVTILEAFRALVQAGFRPEVPVEFHWYAAEEGTSRQPRYRLGIYESTQGHRGHGSVCEYALDTLGWIHELLRPQDMTAYVDKDTTPTMTFITDNVDMLLTNWAMNLATEYSSSPVTGAKLLYVAFSAIVSFHT